MSISLIIRNDVISQGVLTSDQNGISLLKPYLAEIFEQNHSINICGDVSEIDKDRRQDSITLKNTISNIPINTEDVPLQEIASKNNNFSVKPISYSKDAAPPPKKKKLHMKRHPFLYHRFQATLFRCNDLPIALLTTLTTHKLCHPYTVS